MFSALTRSLLFACLFLSIGALAQAASTATNSATGKLAPPEALDALVAPIALYPDPLLSLVLMASAYPLEVVQADRWVKENKNLGADALKAAADKESWDDSVKSLIATPDVLALMSSKLDWTQNLGNAVVAQMPDVMDAIQRLRSRAEARNSLASTKEQVVSVNQVNDKKYISIEPADPNTVYVPYYDPNTVYGSWPSAEYPAAYFEPLPGYYWPGVLGAGVVFGAGYGLARWATGGYRWGGGVAWNRGGLIANRPIGGVGSNWRPQVQPHQGIGNNRLGNQDFRGRNGNQVLNPNGAKQRADRAGNRANNNRNTANRGSNRTASNARGGNRNAASNRAAGNRTAQRQGGNRGGQRAAHHGRPGGGRAAARGGFGGGHPAMARGGFGGGRSAMARGGHGGRGGFGGRGGGRRSDIRLKHDVALIGCLDGGVGFYRFVYNGGHTAYVGVMAQEIQTVKPDAVLRDRDGYLRVRYDQLGIRMQPYDQWIASGSRIPHIRIPTGGSAASPCSAPTVGKGDNLRAAQL